MLTTMVESLHVQEMARILFIGTIGQIVKSLRRLKRLHLGYWNMKSWVLDCDPLAV